MSRFMPHPATGRAAGRAAPAGHLAAAGAEAWTERLTVWAIGSVLLAAVGREVLGQTFVGALGFYDLHIVDPAIVLVLLACMANLTRRTLPVDLVGLAVITISVLLVGNALRGLFSNAAPALLWLRSNAAFGGLLVLALVAPPSAPLIAAFKRALMWAAAALTVLACLRLVFGPQLFMTYAYADVGEINDGGRPISAPSALVLSFAAAVAWSDLFRMGRWPGVGKAALALAFPAAEIASGQGTTTIALLAMIGVVVLFEQGPGQTDRRFVGLLVLVLAALSFAALALAMPSLDASQIASGGNWDLQQRSNNLATRQIVWTELMRVLPQHDWADQIFGFPAGDMPQLVVRLSRHTGVWLHSMHSMYFGALPMMGYLGLVAFLFVLGTTTLRVLRAGLRRQMPAYGLALCVGSALFGVSYELRDETLIGVFIALWGWRASQAVVREQARRQGYPRHAAPSLFAHASAAARPSAHRRAISSMV